VIIILVDNGNNAAFLEKVTGNAPRSLPVTLIKNQQNVGYSARNQAIDQSEADYHLVLNPDVLLSKTGLTYLMGHQDTVMICPYCEGEQGRPS